MLKLALTLMLISAVEKPEAPDSRADQIRQMRETKALNLEEFRRPFLEKTLYEFKERRILEQFQEGWYGFHPLLRGMSTGAGFAVGTAFEKHGFRASAQTSLNGYRKFEGSFSIPNLPKLITGHLVFKGTAMEILVQHTQAVPPRPSARTELEIPPELEDVILTCLSKKPDDRPASTDMLAETLARIATGSSWTTGRAQDWWNRYHPRAGRQ